MLKKKKSGILKRVYLPNKTSLHVELPGLAYKNSGLLVKFEFYLFICILSGKPNYKSPTTLQTLV